MNCQLFADRMQSCLDRRQPIDGDPELQRHAKGCPECRSRWETWMQIEETLRQRTGTLPLERAAAVPSYAAGVGGRRREFRPRRLSLTAGLAAAILVGLFVRFDSGSFPQDERRLIADAVLEPVGMELAEGASESDPSPWIRDLSERRWIDQTMPAVWSVRDGVAPLGRSLMQAVTILTYRGSTQAS